MELFYFTDDKVSIFDFSLIVKDQFTNSKIAVVSEATFFSRYFSSFDELHFLLSGVCDFNALEICLNKFGLNKQEIFLDSFPKQKYHLFAALVCCSLTANILVVGEWFLREINSNDILQELFFSSTFSFKKIYAHTSVNGVRDYGSIFKV